MSPHENRLDERIDEALRRRFAPPADLPRQVAAWLPDPARPAAPRPGPRWLPLAAAALVVAAAATAWTARAAPTPFDCRDLVAQAVASPPAVACAALAPTAWATTVADLGNGLQLPLEPGESVSVPAPCAAWPGAATVVLQRPDGGVVLLLVPDEVARLHTVVDAEGTDVPHRRVGDHVVYQLPAPAGAAPPPSCLPRLRAR